jgi:hypothetical protein
MLSLICVFVICLSTFAPPVMHLALRSPRDKEFVVDGENVVPAVHEVLDQV